MIFDNLENSMKCLNSCNLWKAFEHFKWNRIHLELCKCGHINGPIGDGMYKSHKLITLLNRIHRMMYTRPFNTKPQDNLVLSNYILFTEQMSAKTIEHCSLIDRQVAKTVFENPFNRHMNMKIRTNWEVVKCTWKTLFQYCRSKILKFIEYLQ